MLVRQLSKPNILNVLQIRGDEHTAVVLTKRVLDTPSVSLVSWFLAEEEVKAEDYQQLLHGYWKSKKDKWDT